MKADPVSEYIKLLNQAIKLEKSLSLLAKFVYDSQRPGANTPKEVVLAQETLRDWERFLTYHGVKSPLKPDES